MKNFIIIIIVLVIVAIGFYVNETAPQEAGYDKVTLVKM